MLAKNFKVIASVVALVGMAKIANVFSDICIDFLNFYKLLQAQKSFTIPSILFLFIIPSKQSIFNKNIVSGKSFKAIRSVVYPVDMTKDFEHFVTILSSIAPLDSA